MPNIGWIEIGELRRVEGGGHYVSETTVRRRYGRSLRNFFRLYLPLADEWRFYDNSLDETVLLVRKLPGASAEISNVKFWESIKTRAFNGE